MNKLSAWENELWHYVSNGSNLSCHHCIDCSFRTETELCCCPVFGNALKDTHHTCTCRFGQSHGKNINDCLCHNSNIPFIEILRPGHINELVQKLAERFLSKGQVYKAPVPSSLINLVDDKRKIEIRYLPLKACNGALWANEDNWVIYINNNDSPAEQKVTLFHEAFHILSHLNVNPVFKKPGRVEGNLNEILADNFAMQILMPRKFVETSWDENRDIPTLAKQFQVSDKALTARLLALNLINT